MAQVLVTNDSNSLGPEWISVLRAARYLRVTSRTIHRAIADGRLPRTARVEYASGQARTFVHREDVVAMRADSR